MSPDNLIDTVNRTLQSTSKWTVLLTVKRKADSDAVTRAKVLTKNSNSQNYFRAELKYKREECQVGSQENEMETENTN